MPFDLEGVLIYRQLKVSAFACHDLVSPLLPSFVLDKKFNFRVKIGKKQLLVFKLKTIYERAQNSRF